MKRKLPRFTKIKNVYYGEIKKKDLLNGLFKYLKFYYSEFIL